MAKVIEHWKVEVYTEHAICNGEPPAEGYQHLADPEFKNGFLILRDETGIELKALNAESIVGFTIKPIYKQEK